MTALQQSLNLRRRFATSVRRTAPAAGNDMMPMITAGPADNSLADSCRRLAARNLTRKAVEAGVTLANLQRSQPARTNQDPFETSAAGAPVRDQTLMDVNSVGRAEMEGAGIF